MGTNNGGKGCSGIIFELFGIDINLSTKKDYLFTLKESILTVNENAFYHELLKVVGDKYIIQSKVRLADIFDVKGSNNRTGAFNKISQRHIDFLLCNQDSLKPVLAIEVDDRSHEQKKRRERDEFVNELFSNSGDLPLLRVKAKIQYDALEIRDLIIMKLGLRNKS